MFDIVTVIVIPFIVQLLKKVNLPTKFAPFAAIVIAAIIVGVGGLFGLTLDVASISDLILRSLGLAGVAVLGYDAVKQLVPSKTCCG